MKRVVLLIFLAGCLMAACSPTREQPSTPLITPTIEAPLTATREPGLWRIMPLGDSLTEGMYPDGHHSYRGYLEMQLRGVGYDFDFVGSQWRLAHGGTDYEHEGHGGFTIGPDESLSSGWSANIHENLERYLRADPDIILLLIGINDLFPTEERPVLPAEAADKLAVLVARIEELAPAAHIFVASLVPVNWEGSAAWLEYEAVNAMAEKLGSASPNDRIYFVDMNRTLEPIMIPSDYTDGVHFAESGARKVAQVWLDALFESGLLAEK